MIVRPVVFLMIGLLWAAPSASLYARHLAIVVQQQTGREVSEPNGNNNSSEEERSETHSLAPARRTSLEHRVLMRVVSCRTESAQFRQQNRVRHDATLGEHSLRNGCGAPLTC